MLSMTEQELLEQNIVLYRNNEEYLKSQLNIGNGVLAIIERDNPTLSIIKRISTAILNSYNPFDLN